jgi:mRNA interferase MazF
MRIIASVQLDERRPALVLTRHSTLSHLTWVTVAPITSAIRGITSEVRVGARNGLHHDSVISCDSITTISRDAVHSTIGYFFDDQEPDLLRAISDAFELVVL